MEQKVFSANELDLIDRQTLAKNYRINLDKLMYLLDTGNLFAYERSRGKLETVYPSMAPERYEKKPASNRQTQRSFQKTASMSWQIKMQSIDA